MSNGRAGGVGSFAGAVDARLWRAGRHVSILPKSDPAGMAASASHKQTKLIHSIASSA
jgi:hypothetical protein